MNTATCVRAVRLAIGLTLVVGANAANAQANAEGALRVKSYKAVVPSPLRDAKGEPFSFDFAPGAAILSNGSVLFAELYEPRVVLADSNGRFVAAAGKKGSGPGEFAARSRVLRLRGDSVGVHDASLRRLSVFDAKLKFVRTEPISELASNVGWNTMMGQFASGSMVLLHRSMASFTAADGVYDTQHILYVSNKGRTIRNFNLPPTRELQVKAGKSMTTMKVPMESVHGVAVCDNGFVTVANASIAVYDTTFKLLSTVPYRGSIDTMTSAERTARIRLHSGGAYDATYERRFRAALDAANPRQVVRYSRLVVSADGLLWFQTGKEAEGRFTRTTVRGEIIDTLYAPYQILHADKRISVASGPFEEDEESPIVIVRQKAAKAPGKSIPPSPLGRCNALVTY